MANELIDSGWESRKLAVIAARFYRGIESIDTLNERVANNELSEAERDLIIRMR